MQTISIDISLYIGIFSKNYCMYCWLCTVLFLTVFTVFSVSTNVFTYKYVTCFFEGWREARHSREAIDLLAQPKLWDRSRIIIIGIRSR